MSDGAMEDEFYAGKTALSTKGLLRIARRCERNGNTHGDLAVLQFESTTYDRERCGISYRQVASAFRELAAFRDQSAREEKKIVYDIRVVQRDCGELVVSEIEEQDSGDPDQVQFVVRAFKPEQ